MGNFKETAASKGKKSSKGGPPLDAWRDEVLALHPKLSDSLQDWRRYYQEGEAFDEARHFITHERTASGLKLVDLPDAVYRGGRDVWNVIGYSNDLISSVVDQQIPTFNVSSGQDGRREALAAKSLSVQLQKFARILEWDKQLSKWNRGAVRLGSYFLSPFLDTGAGPRVADPETGEDLQFGLPNLRAIHPEQVMLPAGWADEDVSRAPFCIIEHVMLVAEIKRLFGERAAEVVPDKDLLKEDGRWRWSSKPYGGEQNPDVHQSAVLLEYYELPTAEHKRGRFWVGTRSGISLGGGDLPCKYQWLYGRLPLILLNYQETDRNLRGRAATHGLRSVNYRLNLIINQRTSSAQKLAAHKLFARPGFDKAKFNNPNETIAEVTGNPPVAMQPPQEAQVVQPVIDMLLALMEMSSGADSVLAGDNPEMVRGVGHYAMLVEIKGKRFQAYGQRYRRGLCRAGQQLLWILLEFLPEEVGVKLFGTLGAAGWKYAKRNAFEIDFNLEVDKDSGVLAMPMVERERIMEAYQANLYEDGSGNPARAIAAVREALGMSNPVEIVREQKLQQTNAELENLAMEEIVDGERSSERPIPVNPEDDHDVHNAAHALDNLELINEDLSRRDLDPLEYRKIQALLTLKRKHMFDHDNMKALLMQGKTPAELSDAFGGQLPIGMELPPAPAPAALPAPPGEVAPTEPQPPGMEIPSEQFGAEGPLAPAPATPQGAF